MKNIICTKCGKGFRTSREIDVCYICTRAATYVIHACTNGFKCPCSAAKVRSNVREGVRVGEDAILKIVAGKTVVGSNPMPSAI